jgi:hypothetical protein
MKPRGRGTTLRVIRGSDNMRHEFRAYTDEDMADVLALELHPIEIREGWASTGVDPTELLALSLSLSSPENRWVVTLGDRICGVFGLTLFEDGKMGVPWFVANKIHIASHADRGIFLRTSREVVDLMTSRCEYMMNVVSLENTKSLKWLRWLGFKYDPTQTFTFDRDPSLHFVLVRKDFGKGGEKEWQQPQL